MVDHVKKLAVFLMTLRERYGVTMSALNFVMGEISCLISYHQAYQSRNLFLFLNEHDINDREIISNLEHLLKQRSEIESAFEVLNSDYRLQKYMRENFKFVPSEEFILGIDEKGVPELYR